MGRGERGGERKGGEGRGTERRRGQKRRGYLFLTSARLGGDCKVEPVECFKKGVVYLGDVLNQVFPSNSATDSSI